MADHKTDKVPTVGRNASAVGALTMGSRVAGLVRDSLFLHLFGASHLADAFLMAFAIPNTFRMLVAEGALTVAFLPIYNRTRQQQGKEAGQRLLAEGLAIFPLLVAGLCGLGIAFAPWIVGVIAPGFADVEGKAVQTVHLTRWMFPYLGAASFVALTMGALNAHGRFAASAASPMIFNMVHICMMLVLPLWIDPPILGVAFGVLAGGLVQVLGQILALARAGLLVWPRLGLSPEIRAILRLMVPALGSLAIYQLNLLVLRFYTSYLGEGAVVYLYNADRFMQLPLGVFGIAIATASLPALSSAYAGGDGGALLGTLGRSWRLTNFVTLPSAVGLAVLATPIVSTVLQHGAFDHSMAKATGDALQVMAVGLVAVASLRLVSQVFFAVHDTRTPMLCGGVALACNALAAPGLAMVYGHVGLAMSLALAAWVQLLTQVFFVRRLALRLGTSLGLKSVVVGALRDGLAALVMGGMVAFGVRDGPWSNGTSWQTGGWLMLAIVCGAGVYALVSWALGGEEMKLILGGVLRRLRRGRVGV